MIWKKTTGRDEFSTVRTMLSKKFGLPEEEISDYLCLSNRDRSYFVLKGTRRLPALSDLFNNDGIGPSLTEVLKPKKSYILDIEPKELKDEQGKQIRLSSDLMSDIVNLIHTWSDCIPGTLNDQGEYLVDINSQDVGPHFDVNLLLGNRENSKDPLLSTPKSVLNRYFQGSFRAGADFQILSTSWGPRPEENGFPLNRQFFLSENGRQIFYSADRKSGYRTTCIHSQNSSSQHTSIHNDRDDFDIQRQLILLPQKKGLPAATELQMVTIKNNGSRKRTIDFTTTGMFGFSNPHCLEEDVVYSTLVTQSQSFQDEKGNIICITPDYHPKQFAKKMRFAILKDEDSFMDSFTTDYTEFIGNGTMEHPEHLSHLSNKLSIKGPSFFALNKKLTIKGKDSATLFFYTGMVDTTGSEKDQDLIFQNQIEALMKEYGKLHQFGLAYKEVKRNADSFSRFLRIQDRKDSDLKAYVNNNLPFQIRYQTFISRSFAQTQKGYREIGFREIQDLLASMHYFHGEGKDGLTKRLMEEWIKNVFPFGYANHNFYYRGKEPGQCSDDALWLIIVVTKYLALTQDYDFLKTVLPTADPTKTRSVYDTLKAIITYSARISIGKHGLPLLDQADWNDCLRIDHDCLTGPKKEEAYLNQLQMNHLEFGVPFESEQSESVMNAFLLIYDIKEMIQVTKAIKDRAYQSELQTLLQEKENAVLKHAYINGFYARVLVNRKNPLGITYIGAPGDGLSEEEGLENGSLYLNSFTWSMLSGVATESQIASMLKLADTYLRSDCGYRLCTSHDLSLVGATSSSTEHYFPGDRENGGVFKHAGMMFATALLKKSKTIKDDTLKKEMAKDAYFMIDQVLPYKVMDDPFLFKGNPRFCTQYTNPVTKENVGPILSGTATWLALALFESIGLRMEDGKLILSPMLKVTAKSFAYHIHTETGNISVKIRKPRGKLCDETKMKVFYDKEEIKGNTIPLPKDGMTHSVRIEFR